MTKRLKKFVLRQITDALGSITRLFQRDNSWKESVKGRSLASLANVEAKLNQCSSKVKPNTIREKKTIGFRSASFVRSCRNIGTRESVCKSELPCKCWGLTS